MHFSQKWICIISLCIDWRKFLCAFAGGHSFQTVLKVCFRDTSRSAYRMHSGPLEGRFLIEVISPRTDAREVTWCFEYRDTLFLLPESRFSHSRETTGKHCVNSSSCDGALLLLQAVLCIAGLGFLFCSTQMLQRTYIIRGFFSEAGWLNL